MDLAAQGKYKEARVEFDKVLEVDPFSESAKRLLKVIQDVTDQKIEQKTAIHLFKGISYGNKNQYDKAISHFTQAIEINPKLALAYINRGLCYDEKGQHDEAISDYIKAINLNPNSAWAYENRGVSHRKKGQYDKAIADFTRVIEINPRDADAYYNRGLAYFSKRDYEKAWDDVHKAESLGYKVQPEFLKDLREASGRQK